MENKDTHYTIEEKLAFIHSIMLDEIKALHYICEKNDIYYFANGGTCLGSVREKGFIPWDDDVDIGFFREDYEKFISVAQKELDQYTGSPYKLYITDHNGVRGYRLAADIESDIIDNKTVEIDFVILDKLPKSIIKQKLMRFRLISYRAMIRKPRGKMSFLKKAFAVIMGKIGDWKTYKGVQKSHDNLATKYNKSENIYPYYLTTNDAQYITLHKSYLGDWFKDRTLVDFEDTKIYIPKMYDEYLTYEYGNYMERPPIDKQKPDHNHI